ncbi:MAG: ABC transporter permease [Elusimicrobia bacterium]|nr:ABC transporter permease [Elusimicrobiota bacterium]
MLRLAWRNVWRNRRRSLITVSSLGFGLAAIMFGQSLIKTLQAQLVEKATGSITGHLQVQHRSIKDYKFPDRYLERPERVEAALRGHPGIAAYGKRIHVTGLVSTPVGSVGALVCAVEPDKERRITTMAGHITRGSYFEEGACRKGGRSSERGRSPSTEGARGIVMGEKLAQRLDLRVGEKAVVMAQASDGSMGAGAFKLVGLYRTGSTAFDSQLVYIPLAAAQELLAVEGKVNHIVAKLRDVREADRVKRELAENLGAERDLQVLSWKDIDHEIVGIQRYQDGLLTVVLAVVFLIVALGILNTLLMSLFERVREFGVLMAVGARPAWVMKLVLIEAACLGFIGSALGLGVGSAIIAYYGRWGLALPLGDAISYFMPFPSVVFLRPAWASHLGAGLCVMAVSFLAALAPALRAGRLRPAEALRHV